MGAAGPAWRVVQCTEARLHARAVVPPDLVWLEGHFPAQPLVAGFVQLDWVLGLARERLGVEAVPEAVEALKFRRPLGPGASVEAHLDARGPQLRFALASPTGGEFASGRVRWGTPRPLDVPAGPLPERASACPTDPPPLRLPQTGRMRLLERVVSHDASATTTEAVVSERTPLFRDGAAPAWLALELLAQGMAAHGGLVGRLPARALLLGTRRLALHTGAFAAGERLWVRAAPLRTGSGLVAFDCALGRGVAPQDAADARARALASAALNAFVEASAPAAGG